jgi:uncharacterized membrane-anchored protein YitT (DUF2179 family)
MLLKKELESMSGCSIAYSFWRRLHFLLFLCSSFYASLLNVLLQGMHLYTQSVIALASASTIAAFFASKTSSVIGPNSTMRRFVL